MSTSKSDTNLKAAKDLIRSKGLEDEFLKAAGLDSLDDLDPKNFAEFLPAAPTQVMRPETASAPVTQRPLSKHVADATTGFRPKSASDVLQPYSGFHITYASRKRLSTYTPSSLMMDYMIHIINDLLSDSFYFKRQCPDFHPYVLRLYFGILFWIQVLRAGRDVRALEPEQHQFLIQFLESYPPESLPITSPLLVLFKTLCASQPEIPTYGKVYPTAPPLPGPARRSDFIRTEALHFCLPNIPGIFALLEDLHAKISPTEQGQQAVYPAKGKHIPVPSTGNAATIFGHHTFPAPNARTPQESWSLVSSGLQYPCEADKKLNEAFSERYNNFGFPITNAADDLRFLPSFLSMDGDISWFSQVKDVASIAASFFEGSGTLADCPPFGVSANQIVVQYIDPPRAPTAPTCSADPLSLFPFILRMNTTARSPPELAESMAATAQTNVRMFDSHPYFGRFGMLTDENGLFWKIRPIEKSGKDDSSYLEYKNIFRGLLRLKV